jgi:FkbM family methyltransferase
MHHQLVHAAAQHAFAAYGHPAIDVARLHATLVVACLDRFRAAVDARYESLRVFGWRAPLISIASRVAPRNTLFPVRASGIAAPIHLRLRSSDFPTFRQIFVDHEYQCAMQREPEVIIDAGANIGLSAIYFANRFPRARIICVEPDAENFSLLTRNVAPYPNVVAVQAALWRENTTVELTSGDGNYWGFQTHAHAAPATSRGRVPAITVERLMADHRLDRVDLLKLDIEGAEKEVLEASASWIDRIEVMVVELHERLKRGCDAAFAAAARPFEWRCERGEHVFVARDGWQGPEFRPRP